VAPTEQAQHRVVEALDAEAEAIDAAGAEGAQRFEIGVAGIALQGDLGLRLDPEDPAGRLQQAPHLGRLHQAGRAAAEEDAVHALAEGGVLAELALDRRQVDVDTVEAAGLAVEVAVRADRQAEREVHVQCNRVHRSAPGSPPGL
jgi:hypothetical protein